MVAMNVSERVSSRAVIKSITLTEPCSRARALKSSFSPARTIRSVSCRWTMARPSRISASSVVAQYLPIRNSAT